MLNKFLRLSTTRFVNLSTQKRSTSGWRSYRKSLIAGGFFGSLLFYDFTFRDAEAAGALHRFLRSAKIACRVSLDYSIGLYGLTEGTDEYNQTLKKIHQIVANRLLDGCLLNGGLYIKLGQSISAINHILPIEYTNTLKKLEDKCIERKPEEVNRLFLEDFGQTPDQLFQEFDYKPIAAASLAQVFRATTHDGHDVAVKVQYIDLQKRFRGDVGTIIFLQELIALVHKNYNFAWIIRDLKGAIKEELDFVVEADNAEKCAKHLKVFDFVHIPKVYRELSGTRVLTAEFIDESCKITDVEGIKRMKLKLKDVGEKFVKIFAYQIFVTGFMHADPHPGNIFVRKSKSGDAELVLLDHGLYQSIPQQMRYNLSRFWEGIVLRDDNLMELYSKKLGVTHPRQFAEVVLQRPLDIDKFSFATKYSDDEVAFMKKFASKRFDIVMGVLQEMPRNLIFVVRNLNIVRAITREHGDIVDRPMIMARLAISTVMETGGNFVAYLRRKIFFEYRLWKTFAEYWCIRNYLRLLERLGRAPSDTSSILDMDLDQYLER